MYVCEYVHAHTRFVMVIWSKDTFQKLVLSFCMGWGLYLRLAQPELLSPDPTDSHLVLWKQDLHWTLSSSIGLGWLAVTPRYLLGYTGWM